MDKGAMVKHLGLSIIIASNSQHSQQKCLGLTQPMDPEIKVYSYRKL